MAEADKNKKKDLPKVQPVRPGTAPGAAAPADSPISRLRKTTPGTPAAPARAPTPVTSAKQIPHATHELAEKDRAKAMKSALEEKAVRAGVVKTADVELFKSEVQRQATAAQAQAAAAPATAQATPGVAKTETIQIAAKPGAPATAGEEAAKEEPEEKKGKKKKKKEGAVEEKEELPEEPEIFPLTEHDKQVDYYPVNPPWAYIQVVYNDEEKETRYRSIEPVLTPQERKILKFIEDTMVDVLDAPPEQIEKKTLEEFLREKFEEVVFDYAIDLGEEEAQIEETRGKILYYIYRDFIGEGRIDVMMRDGLIEDISCDGPHQPVFVYHRKHESIKSNVKFRDDDELDSFVIRMAQRSGKHVSIAEPILDATMPDGSRLQATLAHEVSAHGSTFTIRKFRSEPFTPPDLVRFGTMSAEILAYWWIAIQNGSSAIYAGGTASGKTTGLNAILLFIPPQMKIVSIEDTRELALPHPNWIAGITRGGFGPRDEFGRQAGEIDMFQLLKNALRQRPEYIIVGEVRGKEAYNLFQAMATGHAAYGTMHADSVDSVIHRLESEPIKIPRALLGALDVISIQIQTRVGGKRVRRTKQLSEIVGLDPHTQEILTNEVFRWVPKDDSFKYSGVSYVLERIQVEKGLTPQDMKTELENRVEIIRYLIKHEIRKYRDVGRIVSGYYKDPNQVMEMVRKDLPWK